MTTLTKFTLGQAVRVVSPDAENAGLLDRAGRVVRLRRADNAAWVEMDEPIPASVHAPFRGETDGRERHVMLWPNECAARAAVGA